MCEQVIICEDSMEGILSGVYEAYRIKKEKGIESHAFIHLVTRHPDMYRLFTEYTAQETNPENADKVAGTIKARLGSECCYQLCLAMASCFEDKADAGYHTIVLGLRTNDRRILDRLGEECVQSAFRCARASSNELCHMMEFTRFRELEGGILYAEINAKHHILPFLMPHFADRLPAENFVIYDKAADIYGLHPGMKPWYLAQGVEPDSDRLKSTDSEKEYSALFQSFCRSVAIESRMNLRLQASLLPLRFRPDMTEWKGSGAAGTDL
ncbi:MAG: TIGR03915 family putative DNA repair protein [Lachnospiraceae bacterium]|nr:TIGR03915 family putative DNA repair protein [Lachnospiraceae bacterium]